MAWYNSSTKWSGKTKYGGKTVNNGTRAILEAANAILQHSPRYGKEREAMTIVQGSYNGGGVAASAGTHDGGGAFDLTPFNDKNRVKVLRLLGTTTNIRPTIRNLWSRHLHGIVVGDGTASRGAKGQVTEFLGGGDGLVGNAKDPDWRPRVLPILFVAPWDSRGKPGVRYALKDDILFDQPSRSSTKRGTIKKGKTFTVVAVVNVKGTLWAVNANGNFIESSRITTKKPVAPKPTPKPTPTPTPTEKIMPVGTFNFPDKTKITTIDEATRIKEAVRRIRYRNLHVVGMQELVGVSGGKASDLAQRFHEALGTKDWDIVIPTTAYNENYYFTQKRYAEIDKQFADEIIRGTVGGAAIGGRHVTRVRVNTVLGLINFGNTHLISGNRPGAEVQAGLAASAVSEMGSGIPRILLGDFNTPGPLTALAAAGLRNARLTTEKKDPTNYATYTNYKSDSPVIGTDLIIDGLWHSAELVPKTYWHYMRLDDKGKFILPRPSDHVLVSTELKKA